MYRYDSEQDVPITNFNANSMGAKKRFTFTGSEEGSSYSIVEDIMSSEKVIYRAVRKDAP
jgi:hypothetical protein